MTEHTYTDPAGSVWTIVLGDEDATTGIRHDGCAELATVTPELDVAYCDQCGWQCRISGAFYLDLLAVTKQALADASTKPLEDQWKAERDRAAAVLAEDHHAPLSEDDPAVQAGLAAVGRLIGTLRTEPAGMAYIVGAIDAARAQANWVPWWLEPVIATELSIGDKCPCCGEEWTGA